MISFNNVQKESDMLKRNRQDMLQGPLFPGIIAYTIPIILTGLLQVTFNAADLMIVGRFCGKASVAAVGATGAITNLVVNLFIGLAVGVGVSTAHAIGCRDEEAVHRTVHTALPTAIIGGIVLTLFGTAFSETLLTWMDTPEDVLPLSTTYMEIYFCGMTFHMVYNYCASILRAAGDTRSPLIFLTAAGFLNVCLNVLFVTMFHMNVAGVALATTISQGVSAVLVVWALMRRSDACHLNWRKLHIYKKQLTKIVSLGLPAGLQGSMFSISNVLIQSSVNAFGTDFVSGNAACANLEGFLNVILNSFHQTGLNFTGQNVGAGQYKRVGKILTICLTCAGGVGILLGTGVWYFGPELLSIYITDSAEAIRVGVLRMTYVCLPYFMLGLMDVTTGVLRGLGSSVTPMLISVAGVCVFRILWIKTVFAANPLPEILYLSYPISWVLTFVAELIAFLIIYRRRTAAYPE